MVKITKLTLRNLRGIRWEEITFGPKHERTKIVRENRKEFISLF